MKGIAPGRVVQKELTFNKDKMLIISAAGYNQVANAYSEKGHRLFSYFLLKNLLVKNMPSIPTLFENIRKNVKDKSRDYGDNRMQEPNIEGNQNLSIN